MKPFRWTVIYWIGDGIVKHTKGWPGELSLEDVKKEHEKWMLGLAGVGEWVVVYARVESEGVFNNSRTAKDA